MDGVDITIAPQNCQARCPLKTAGVHAGSAAPTYTA